MSSINIWTLRRQYPGKGDTEIAAQLAEKDGYVVVLRYKSRIMGAADYTNFAVCTLPEEVESYFDSPNCGDVEILHVRSRAHEVTQTLLLQSRCELCGRGATRESLTIGGGNDFYFCPNCAAMFCESCCPGLPVVDNRYVKCPDCDVQVHRALPGGIGVRPLQDEGKRLRRRWRR